MPTDDEHQKPAGRRWIRWFLLYGLPAVLVAIVLAATAWLAWDARAASRLSAERDALRALGVAPTFAEFRDALPRVSDAENAALDYQAAAELVDTQMEAWEFSDFAQRPPTLPHEPAVETEATWADLEQAVSASAAALERLDGVDAKVRPSVDRVRADFGIDWRPGAGRLLYVVFPDLNSQAYLATVIGWAILADANRGDFGRLGIRGRRLIGQADAVDAGHPTLIGHMVATGVERRLIDAVLRIVPLIEVGDATGNLPPDDARELVGLLLDDGPRRDGWRAAVAGEITLQQDAVDGYAAGENVNRGGRLPTGSGLVRPSIRNAGATMAHLAAPLLSVADADVLPGPAADALAEHGRRATPMAVGPSTLGEVFTAGLVSGLEHAAENEFRARTQRRLAAVAVAVAMYRGENGGALPPSLDALVPAYLPDVPRDPMAADAPLRYDAGRGIAWSVGDDATDNGGAVAASPKLSDGRLNWWESPDFVLPLVADADLTPTTNPPPGE